VKPDEVESSPILRAIGLLLCLHFFFTFSSWNVDLAFGRAAARFATALPVAGMQGLSDWVQAIPSPYIRVVFQALGLASLAAAAGFLQPGGVRRSLQCLVGLLVCKAVGCALDLRNLTAHHQLHLAFSAVFLLPGQRLQGLRLALAVASWMWAGSRLSNSWLGGLSVYSLPSGLPLLPHSLGFIRLFCWLVFLLEILAPLAFWSSALKLRRAALLALLTWYAYFGLLAGLGYAALVVPLAALLVVEGFQQSLRQLLPSRPAVALLALVLLCGLWQLVIPGDVRLSAEGRYLGLSAGDSGWRTRALLRVAKGRQRWEFRLEWSAVDASLSRACQVQVLRNGQLVPAGMQSARGRVFFNPGYFSTLPSSLHNDPYVYLHWANQVQRRARPDELSLELWTRLDGQTEEIQTVKLMDLARQTPSYNSLWRNSWIMLPGEPASR